MQPDARPVRSIVAHLRPPSPSAPERLPTYRALLRTLDISVRFLSATATGGGTFDYADELLRGWATDILRYGNLALDAAGLEAFDRREPFVVMSNHGSMLDIPVLTAAVPTSLRMVTKEELMRVPIWGRAMIASGFIPISRGDRARAIRELDLAKQRLAQGISVWISPEGTRSRDGQLGPFKKGGFYLALDLGIPILPTWLEGVSETLPARTLRVRCNQRITVRFGQPISTSHLGRDAVPALMDRVRASIVELSGRPDPLAVA
ncbi:MAG: lysophospholipid acyltransferase family protein [Byssovorax sp.]